VIIKFIKYTALIALLKAYKNKIYIFLSLIAVFFLIDHIYDDVRNYLEATHPDYLVFALWIKTALLIILFIALLILFKPKKSTSDAPKSDIPTRKDQEIIQSTKEKKDLVPDSFTQNEKHEHQKDNNGDVVLTDADVMIIEEIRNKKKLETRADKVIKELTGK
jgi:amino acid permease